MKTEKELEKKNVYIYLINNERLLQSKCVCAHELNKPLKMEQLMCVHKSKNIFKNAYAHDEQVRTAAAARVIAMAIGNRNRNSNDSANRQ